MKDRCLNPKCKGYPRWGGRGISICEEWKNSYPEFKKWALGAGYQERLQIERSNNDGNYEPGNCRWATQKEQNRNKRSNIHVTFNGVTKVLAEWVEEFGLRYSVVYSRLYRYKWPVEKAFLPIVTGKDV